MKKSKKHLEALGKIEKNKLYTKEEAVKLVKEVSNANFDESVELAFRLNLDPRKADQQLRGAIVLPKGIGKTKKILVIAKGDAAKAATEAGADYVGDTDMLDKIQKENWFDFDVMIATPDMMPALGKIGRILGPKGLMPNPKTGTVTMDVAKAVQETKAGKVTYRTDKDGNVHLPIGRVSFTDEQLIENFKTINDLLVKSKPSSAKGTYMKNVVISTTMGPSIKVQASM